MFSNTSIFLIFFAIIYLLVFGFFLAYYFYEQYGAKSLNYIFFINCLFCIIAFVFEIIQLFEGIHGTFDIFDLLTIATIALLDSSVYKFQLKGKNYEEETI